MSAYGHILEREVSAQNLSSRGGSERESHYAEESGFYMTSYAAIIFVASLATLGVLLITLLIALAVMLQNCESRNAGVSELQKSGYDQNDCKMLALHAELNNLEPDHFPVMCRALAVQYVREGRYAKDLDSTMWMVENYFGTVKTPLGDGLDVVLMDIDEILSSDSQHANLLQKSFDHLAFRNCTKEVKLLKRMLIHRMYRKLRASSWPIIFLSRKAERQRNATIENLISAGYIDWSNLIMRSEDELKMDSGEYFSRQRTRIRRGGYRIVGMISSQLDALRDPYPGKRVFKIPNPPYYNFKHQVQEWTDTAA